MRRGRDFGAYREAQLRRGHVARSVSENQAALHAARQRYSEGAIDFLNVITAQAQLLQSENDLADGDTQIATYLVNLYRALGGGWEVADVAFNAATTPRQKIEARCAIPSLKRPNKTSYKCQ
jgi:outer membrane protein TolC